MALEGLFKFERIDEWQHLSSLILAQEWRLQVYDRKRAQTGDVEFESHGHLTGREGLMTRLTVCLHRYASIKQSICLHRLCNGISLVQYPRDCNPELIFIGCLFWCSMKNHKDHQSQLDSSSGDEYLYKTSWQSIQQLFRYFSLDWHCHPYSHAAGMAKTMLSTCRVLSCTRDYDTIHNWYYHACISTLLTCMHINAMVVQPGLFPLRFNISFASESWPRQQHNSFT